MRLRGRQRCNGVFSAGRGVAGWGGSLPGIGQGAGNFNSQTFNPIPTLALPLKGRGWLVFLMQIKINTAGGSPAARHFLLLRQKESNQRKGDPGLPPLRGSLRCSTGQAAAELALRAQTVLADIPCPACATRRRTGE